MTAACSSEAGGPLGAEGRARRAGGGARLQRLFPQIGTLETEFWYTGFMAKNADNSWHVHELAPGVMAMLGCNGRGIVLGTLVGPRAGAPCRRRAGPASSSCCPRRPGACGSIPWRGRWPPALIRWYALRDAVEDAPARTPELGLCLLEGRASPMGRPAGPAPFRLGGEGGARSAIPALDGSETADVVVVGAGYTGLSAALHLALAAVRAVLVVDAHEPGWGASGRNNGQVVAALKHEPHEIERRFGHGTRRLP